MARRAVAYLIPRDSLPDRHSGLDVVRTVSDPDPDRSRLAEALTVISAGQAETLLVARVRSVAATPGALLRIVEWLEAHRASLVARDVELDTAGRCGRQSIALLRGMLPGPDEPGPSRRAPGRPGLQHGAPDLVDRISLMHQNGASLQAIADALNADSVPTPRGGAHWRPSSVQTALGYRRPRPPARGAPPAPRHPEGGPGPAGRRGRPGPGGRP